MVRGGWQPTVHTVSKSQTQLQWLRMHIHTHARTMTTGLLGKGEIWAKPGIQWCSRQEKGLKFIFKESKPLRVILTTIRTLQEKFSHCDCHTQPAHRDRDCSPLCPSTPGRKGGRESLLFLTLQGCLCEKSLDYTSVKQNACPWDFSI